MLEGDLPSTNLDKCVFLSVLFSKNGGAVRPKQLVQLTDQVVAAGLTLLAVTTALHFPAESVFLSLFLIFCISWSITDY